MAMQTIKFGGYVDEEVLVHTKVSGNNIIIVSSEAFACYVVTV